MIKTPCISICRYENDRCIGCGRTQEEVIGWMDYTDQERDEIMKRLEEEIRDQFD